MVMFRSVARSLEWQAPEVAFQSAPQLIGRAIIAVGILMGWIAWGLAGLVAIPIIAAISGMVVLFTTRDFILSTGCLGLPVVLIVGIVALVVGRP